LKGNFLQSNATITNQETGQSVAEIKKQSWTLKTEYHITVAPGVDLALVVALCLTSHDRQEVTGALEPEPEVEVHSNCHLYRVSCHCKGSP
jgi:LURP-one-related